MIRKITLLFLACLGFTALSNAQKCGFDKIHQQLMQQNPEYAAAVNSFNINVAKWISQQQAQKGSVQKLMTTFNGKRVWEIPVVVHVIHTGQPVGTTYNPSNTTITNFINYLSQAFNASYVGHLLEASGGTPMPIAFKLAQRDPSGAATIGIVRYDASGDVTYAADGVGSPGIPDGTLKAFSFWPNTEYYNVWIVNKIDGANASTGGGPFTAGYATLPPAGILQSDGTVVLADQVGVGNSVITHELGHAFGLLHVFQGGDASTCPPAPDDYVADTEPIRQSPFNCPSDPNPCTGSSFKNTQHNFMDYSNCKDRFTPGQRVRVWASLQNLTGMTGVNAPFGQATVRTSLVSSLGATPPTPAVIAATCTPSNAAPVGGLGLRSVTVVKPTAVIGDPDTILMNAISGSSAIDGSHYLDRTKQHRVELEAGKTYKFSATVGGAPESVIAYIDYDNNGTFGVLEQIHSSAASPGTHTFTNFTVPVVGATYCTAIRMRVVSGGASPCPGGAFAGQAEDYEVVIRGSGTTSTTPGLATLITPPLGGNPSCLGSTVTVAATYKNTITPAWYVWFKKDAATKTVTQIKSSIDSFVAKNDWTHLDTVWAKVAYPGLCGVDTAITDSIVLYRPITVAPAVTIGVTKGTNPGCPDDTVRFTVTNNVNPGGAPTYEWFVNGISQGPASTTPYLEKVNIASGTTFYVKMVSSAPSPCSDPGFATSNTITYTHTTKVPTLSIALIGGTNPGCPNQILTFKATGTTAGTSPTFNWKVNSISVQNGLSDTYASILNNGDIVSCTMTSSTSCAVPNTANSSNTITITHTPLTADITIQLVTTPPLCTGHPIVFTANPVNAGANPQFQWMINNQPVPSANSPIFSTTSLLNGDQVSCILIATDPCVSNTLDTSSAITMTMTTSKLPSVTVAITQGNNPGCLDSLIEFTATDKNLGVNPNFDWLVNSFPTFNGQVFSTTSLLNGDVVVCRANQTDGGCYLPDTVFSAPITMVRSVTPEPPIISLVNNRLVTSKTGSFIWFGPDGQLDGGFDGNFHPTKLGQYYCVTNNNGCWSKPSNKLTITLLDINDYVVDQARVYPNPTTGKLIIDWGNKNVTMQIDVYSTVGQKLLHTDIQDKSRKEIDLTHLANGIYFVTVTDTEGKSNTTRITVTK